MPSKKTSICAFLLILVICFMAYANSVSNHFIWDDDALVVKNTSIRSLNFLPQLFNDDLYSGSVAGSNFYRPMQSFSYMLDYHFGELNPAGYHITNILLQALVGFLVFLLFYALINNTVLSFAAALMFSVSPLHTEAVTYVSGRAEMLLGIFSISSLLFFIKIQNQRKIIRSLFLFLSLASFVFALLSKELAVVFPFVILAYLYYFKMDKSPRYFLKKVWPFFAISGAYIILRISLLNFHTLRPLALMHIPFFIRLTVIPKIILTYIKLLIYPVGLHMSWELVRPTSVAQITVSLFALCLIIFFCFRLLRDKKSCQAAFFLSWSLIFFLPQSGIFPINAFVSEHFIYLSSIPYFLLVAFILNRYLRAKLFIIAVAGIVIFYVLLTAGRNYEWSNPVVFYKKIIQVSPSSFQAHNNLGLQYEYKGLDAFALEEYKQALKIKPDLLEAHSNLANLYFKLARYAEALSEYKIVEKTVPLNKEGEVQNNIANVYEAKGLYDQAEAKYKLALKLDGSLSFAHFNLARIYFTKGNKLEAARQVYYSLFNEGASSQEAYLRVISGYLGSAASVPGAKEFYNNLGVRFAGDKLIYPAIACFKKALQLDHDFQDAYFNLGLAAWQEGRKKEALFSLRACLRRNPNHLKAKGLLAEILRKK